MKRKLLPLIAIALVFVMAGCAALAADNNKVEHNPDTALGGAQTTQTQPSAEKTTKTVDQAKQIAFDHAAVKAADVKDLEVELDNDGGVLHFNISFDAGNYDYDYEIDAYSGKILKDQKEEEKAPAETKPAQTTKKTKAEAKKIAFDHAGVKEANVRDLEIEPDKENGKEIYEVSFESGSYDYEYEIDAYSGKILHSEKERDD